MPKIEPFERHAPAYDAWFDAHPWAFRSEVEALGRFWPRGCEGLEVGVGGVRAHGIGFVAAGMQEVFMKIAVPMVQGRFSDHFGGAEGFGLFEVDEVSRIVVSRVFQAAPPHERGAFPRWLKEQGADVILAGGMGPRAMQMFEHFGIHVVAGVSGGDPEALVKGFLDGTLQATGEGCSGGHLHNCGDHGHDD